MLTLDKSFSDHFIKDWMGKNEKREQKLRITNKQTFITAHRSPTDAASDPMLHPVNGSDHPIVDSSDPPTYAFPCICLRFVNYKV